MKIKRMMWSLILCIALSLLISPVTLAVEPDETATLYAVFADDYETDGWIEQYELGYSGELTAYRLAEGLTALTGLDFFIDDVTLSGPTITIDWSEDATVVKGLDDRAFSEPFIFYDVDSLSGFMLDSLALTLRNNLYVQNVCYTMNGGTEFWHPELFGGYFELAIDEPYLGSGYYWAVRMAMQDDVAPAEETAQCPDCGGWFEVGNIFRNHICSNGSDAPEDESLYEGNEYVQCPDCEEWFEAGNIFRNHICANGSDAPEG